MTEKIELTLGTETESQLKGLNAIAAQADQLPVTEKEPAPKAVLDMSCLTPDEQAQVKDFAQKIDVTNASQILQYGAGAQKKRRPSRDFSFGRRRFAHSTLILLLK